MFARYFKLLAECFCSYSKM